MARGALLRFGASLLVLNLLAAAVAVALNWPSQFGSVGTDAGAELLTRGTAISAPLLPVALLVVSLLLVWRGGRALVVGAVGALLTAVVVLIGGIGELTAKATSDTPKAVLVVAGLAWILIAAFLAWLAVGALREQRRSAR